MNLTLFNNNQYKNWLADIKQRIKQAQIKAAVKVNAELINVYWQLGKEIIEKQETANWGDALIEQLSKDLCSEFPYMKGFSKTNLFYIRRWYLFYKEGFEKLPQLVAQLANNNQLLSSTEILPQLVAQIPWGHNREIITKCTDAHEALFYLQKTVQNNWSRVVLLMQIESKLYHREGKAINNFALTLPQPQADLAIETLKNPYNFDFITIGEAAQERDLEIALATQMQKFLLELGQGFAFMGRQYNINVGGDDFRIDLLFYHTKLRCHIVVELKVTEFEPEFAGKLNFYLNAIDAQIKHPDDQPTIGILLCKTPNKVVVEYALKNMSQPLGVAEYQLTHAIPEELRGELPTIEELEVELEKEVETLSTPVNKKIKLMNDLLSTLNEEEVQEKLTLKITKKIFSESILSLDKIFLTKMEAIQKNFAKVKIYYQVSSSGYPKIEEAIKLLNNNHNIYQLGLSYYFEGFKKAGINAFNQSTNISFELRDYYYEIKSNNNQPAILKKLYHQFPTTEELNDLADAMVEDVVDKVNSELERMKK